jgi:dipeptidyl aminopeptidase/acylaminoacyl peptidase
MRKPLQAIVFALALAIAAPVATVAQDAPTTNPDASSYITPPPALQNILETDKNYATLRYMSPDGEHFLIPHVNELSTLELMSKETYRLAELELRPQTDRLWHLDTYGIDSFGFYSLESRDFLEVDLPDNSFFSDFTWSPDGSQLAFLAHLPTHTEVWTADAENGRTRSLSNDRVLATVATSARGQGTRPSNMIQWTPEGTVISLLVPEGRGAEPARSRMPTGPLTRNTRAEATRTRTYPNLLEDAHDEMLFERYTTSQIAELGDGDPKPIGEPGMYESIRLSADGEHILTTRMERPFSFITSYQGFPRTTLVMDRDGNEVSVLNETPLREGGGFGGPGGGNGPRAFAWRPDGAGLGYLERAARDDEDDDQDDDAPRPDLIMVVTAPFDLDDGQTVAESEDPISGVSYSLDGQHAFGNASKNGQSGIRHFAVGSGGSASMFLDFHDTDDPADLPGSLLTGVTSNGLSYVYVTSNGGSAYLKGDGYNAQFTPQPFVDRVSIADASTDRVFEGATDSFDQPLVPLDADFSQMIASRESVYDFPDSYLWSADSGYGPNLTNNVDPFPEVTSVSRMDFEFERRDGLMVQGRVSMPVGWEPGDEKVPGIFWTYPREYNRTEQYENAAVRSRNRNAFTHMSWLRWSDMWLAAGYALIYPDIPIIGENYNDTYISSLVDAMYGAIRGVDALGVVDVDRLAHGGHSYGAFATANVLANAPFFKAGIAGDGAYNRTLTPDGFQAERRNIWEAQSTYIEMSPFLKADQIETPLLMYHGGDDNNSGTFPIQSRRMISALTILGKNAVLYEYPYESHTPRAIENKLDMWGRFTGWLDEYVKNAGKEAVIS